MKSKSHQLYLLITFLFVPLLSHAQHYLDWVKKTGGTVHTYAKAQAVDNQGNVYITGDNPHFFIHKFDSLGNILWEKTAGSTLRNINALATDNNGNIYLAGEFIQSHDFDWSDDAEHIITVGEESIFIAKYDKDGNFQWVHYAEESDIQLNELEIAPNGNIILVGNFTNTVNIALNGANQEITANEFPNATFNTYTIFLAQYAPNGNLLHHLSFGGQGNDLVRSIAFGPAGKLIAAGEIGTINSSNVDTVLLGATEYLLPSGTIQGFLVEINTDWQITKSLIIEGGLTVVTGMDVDDDTGDIFVTGRKETKCFVAKYGADFLQNWEFEISGMKAQFSKKAVLSKHGFWLSGEGQGFLTEQLFFYHSDSTYTFQKVGDNGFNRMYLALLDKTTGMPLDHQMYTTNWYTSVVDLNIGKNDALYFSGDFNVEQSFDDSTIPYVLTSGFVNNEYKTNVYIARRTPLCKPIEILGQPDTSQILCGGDNEYEVQATGTGLRYQWYQDDVAMSDFSSTTLSIYIAGAQTNHLVYGTGIQDGWSEDEYFLEIASSCGDYAYSDTIRTTVFGNPSVIVAQPNNYATVGDVAKLIVQVWDDYPDPAFQWYKGQVPLVNGIHFSGVDTDTLTINNVVLADEANYFCLVGSQYCSLEEVKTVSTLLYLGVRMTATRDLQKQVSAFDIFPNPTNGKVSIAFQEEEKAAKRLQIADVYGKIVKQLFLKKNHPDELSIDVQNIPSGIYTITVFSEKTARTKKLIIR